MSGVFLGSFGPVALMGNSPEAVVTYRTSVSSTADGTTYLLTGLDFGPENHDRRIIVGAVGGSSGGARTITAASSTIGGVTPTKPIELTVADDTCGMLIATVPTGTTGQEISIVYSGTMHRFAMGVWAVTGLASNTANSTLSSSATPPSGTIDLRAGGIAVVMACSRSSTSAAPTGYTERFDDVVESLRYAGGDYSAGGDETGRTIITTFNTHSNPLMVAAAFGP